MMVDVRNAFYYRRCCRVWPLIHGVNVGKCGLCNRFPEIPATREEYDAQPPLVPPVDDFSPLSLLDDLPF